MRFYHAPDMKDWWVDERFVDIIHWMLKGEKNTSEHAHIYKNRNMNTNTTMWIMQFICVSCWYMFQNFFSLSSSSTVLNKHMQNIQNKRFYFVYE